MWPGTRSLVWTCSTCSKVAFVGECSELSAGSASSSLFYRTLHTGAATALSHDVRYLTARSLRRERFSSPHAKDCLEKLDRNRLTWPCDTSSYTCSIFKHRGSWFPLSDCMPCEIAGYRATTKRGLHAELPRWQKTVILFRAMSSVGDDWRTTQVPRGLRKPSNKLLTS